jgi:SAM-dependent methyltransferase
MWDLLNEWIDRIPLGRALDLGAGEGETAYWLASRGFTVDAIEKDPRVFAQLSASVAGTGIQPHLADLTEFQLPHESYHLIIAQATLHFLRPTDLWSLADRISQALTLGGFFIAEVFTIDDPGYSALQDSGVRQIEPNTFLAPEPIGIIHYFEPGELRSVFAALEVVVYEESRRLDQTSVDGYRGGATLLAKRTDKSDLHSLPTRSET